MHMLRSLQIGQNFQILAVLSNVEDIAELSRMLMNVAKTFIKNYYNVADPTICC